MIAGTDDAEQAAFAYAVGFKHFFLLRLGKSLEFFFQAGADFYQLRPARACETAQRLHMGVVFRQAVLVHIGAVNNRLRSEQRQFAPHLAERLVEFRHLIGRGGPAFVQVREQLPSLIHSLCQFPVALDLFLEAFQALGHAVDVGQQQFCFNRFHIAQRVNAAVHMGNIFVFKAAHHFHDGRAFTDIGQELVAQSFALARPSHQTGNVDEVHRGVNGLGGSDQLGQGVYTGIRHRHRSLVRLDGAEGIIRGLGVLRPGQCVEKRGFAHIGQSDDAYAQCHGMLRAEKVVEKRKKADISSLKTPLPKISKRPGEGNHGRWSRAARTTHGGAGAG